MVAALFGMLPWLQSGCGLCDGREPDGVVIAPGEQRPARRRAQGGGVEVIVAQSAGRELVQVQRFDRSP
jgi:hypothetical protein